jgi:hypothetical protein
MDDTIGADLRTDTHLLGVIPGAFMHSLERRFGLSETISCTSEDIFALEGAGASICAFFRS